MADTATPELVARAVTALDRTDIRSVREGESFGLLLPDDGVRLADLARFVEAVLGEGESEPFTEMGAAIGHRPSAVPNLTRFEVDPAADGKRVVWLGFAWPDARWDPIPGLLAVARPGLEFELDQKSKALRATLSGEFVLADELPVDVFASLARHGDGSKHLAVAGSLAAGGPYSLSPLLQRLGLDLPGLHDLALGELSFRAGGSEPISFTISLADVWSPGWGDGKLEVRKVTLSLVSDESGTTGSLAGEAVIGGVETDIVVTRGEDDWELAGGAHFGDDPLELGKALIGLGEQFGLGDVLAEAPGLDKLAIEDLSFEAGLADRQLTFRLTTPNDAKHTWSPCAGLAVSGLELEVKHTGGPESRTKIGRAHV